MPVEPQITPVLVMSQSQPVVTTATPTTTTPSATTPARTKYPKRENRKPPAHLAEAFGPALFSTPDIIRRVSTDKPTTPNIPTTPCPQLASSTPIPDAETSATSKRK